MRVLPCDVLPYKHYSLAVIALLAGTYAQPSWAQSLRAVAWELLGERTPAHTTLHGWSEGLGAHALELPAGMFDGARSGWPFARVLAEAAARYPAAQELWITPVWVDPRRYRSEGRCERLAAVARLMALAPTVSETAMPHALGAWCALTVRWSGSFGLRFPSTRWCTAIEHRSRQNRRGSRARAPPRDRRCPTPTRSPPGASSKSPR